MCNLEVYMHFEVCMHEHFDLIISEFKYTYEICQIFIYPFQKIVMRAKCNFLSNRFDTSKDE